MPDTHLAILLDRLVRRIHMNLRERAPDFDTEQIGPGGALVLLTLDETGQTSMNELARRLVRDKSQMTRAIRSLEAKGLVRRDVSPKDSRVSLIEMTEAGEQVVRVHQDVLADILDQVLQPLSDQDKRRIRDLLDLAVSNGNPTPTDA